MAKIEVTVDDSVLQAKLAAIKGAATNLEPVHATIGRLLVNKIRLGFKLGIDPWGSPWAALKIRKGQPLRDSGRLNRSISSTPDSTGVTVGTNLIYAPVQQFGATIVPKNKPRLVFPGPGGKLIFAKKVTIPGRPFLPLTKGSANVDLPPEWSKAAVRALRDYFNAAAKEA